MTHSPRSMLSRSAFLVLPCVALAVGAPGCNDELPQAPATTQQKTPLDALIPAPPTPEAGWQYDIPKFEVPKGSETQGCYFFEVPYDVPVYASRIVVAQNEGTHHMNIFRVKTIKGLGGKPGDSVINGECFNGPNWADWPLVYNTQLPNVTDWTLPDGVAMRFEPRELLMVQTHFVNATTQQTPTAGKVDINFERLADADVKNELGTVFATNQNIQICPGDKDKTFDTTCKFTRDTPVTVVAANGHFHSRGKQFTMSAWDSQNGSAAKPFYTSQAWDEPPFENNLNLVIPPDGGISYTCEYTCDPSACGDPNNNCCFTFGPHVDTQEHCNAFVYYYPKRPDTDVNCF